MYVNIYNFLNIKRMGNLSQPTSGVKTKASIQNYYKLKYQSIYKSRAVIH